MAESAVFRFKARVLLELGAELISSDQIALYELVKNAIDAGSRRTAIEIRVVLQYSKYRAARRGLLAATKANFDPRAFVESLEEELESSAGDDAVAFLEPLRSASNRKDMLKALDQSYRGANVIEVSDNGEGMGLSQLRDVYLTIGTPQRLLQKRKIIETSPDARKVPLGEKGIGRLATMRLGDSLEVRSARKQDAKWNYLRVDWAALKDDADMEVEDLRVELAGGERKTDDSVSGTAIRIRMLLADWTEEKLDDLAKTDFAKLVDPFNKSVRRDLIKITLNGTPYPIRPFEHEKLKHADAYCAAKLRFDSGEPALIVRVEYRRHGVVHEATVKGEHLQSVLRYEPGKPTRKAKKELPDVDVVTTALETLGPFEMEFYWFNRGKLMREEPETWAEIREFVSRWSGGLLVFRDGYRVYPYGNPEDDWLDLDRKALSSSAYKLNRAQIIGRLRITSRDNPALQDQTNREGFRDCPEKEALIRLLRHVVISECRSFLESEEAKRQKADDIADLGKLEQRLNESQREAVRRLRDIGKRLPDESETVAKLLDHLRDVEHAWEKAKEIAANFETELDKYLHLAGIGLMVEFIVHELTRATQNSLRLLESRKAAGPSHETHGAMDSLHAQLKTIEKRLRILDPMSVPGRQRRVDCDIRELIDQVLDAHGAQFERHGIKVLVTPRRPEKMIVRVERGQFIQIIENLVANSIYWLREKRRLKPFDPEIEVSLDALRGTVTLHDNGPGIPPERSAQVFDAFFTTKPAGQGRGLGLYIARRLAESNEATLRLADPDNDGQLRTFELVFSPKR